MRQITKEDILKHYKVYQSYRYVAKQLGCSANNILLLVKRYGIKDDLVKIKYSKNTKPQQLFGYCWFCGTTFERPHMPRHYCSLECQSIAKELRFVLEKTKGQYGGKKTATILRGITILEAKHNAISNKNKSKLLNTKNKGEQC